MGCNDGNRHSRPIRPTDADYLLLQKFDHHSRSTYTEHRQTRRALGAAIVPIAESFKPVVARRC